MVKRKTRKRTLKRESIPHIHKTGHFSPYAFGHSLGLISVIALLFYGILVWFSTFNASIIVQQYPISFSFNDWTLLIGLAETYVLGYVGGWIFARLYNKTIK